MANRRAVIVALVWMAAAALFVFAVVGGAVVVLRDPTADNAFRWVMALLFIGTPMAFLWRRDSATVRGVLKR